MIFIFSKLIFNVLVNFHILQKSSQLIFIIFKGHFLFLFQLTTIFAHLVLVYVCLILV